MPEQLAANTAPLVPGGHKRGDPESNVLRTGWIAHTTESAGLVLMPPKRTRLRGRRFSIELSRDMMGRATSRGSRRDRPRADCVDDRD